MKKFLIVMFLVSFAAAANSATAANNPAGTGPAAPPSVKKDPAPVDPTADPGMRKLTRKERKERMKNLSDAYRQFLRDVEPIMLPTELNTFLLLESDAQRDRYIEEFWNRRDADMKTSYNEYRETYKELLVEAVQKFKHASSERSRVYLVRGRPGDILVSDCSQLLQPLEVWRYPYLPGLGRDVLLVFYEPRFAGEMRLWVPRGREIDALAELVAQELVAKMGAEGAVQFVFYGSESPNAQVDKVRFNCKHGDVIRNAIFWSQSNRFEVAGAFEPPKVDDEDVEKILRASVIANPAAAKLDAALTVRYTGKRGSRTALEMTLTVPRTQLALKDVEGTKVYNVDVIGEILKDGKLFESFRYRYDFQSGQTEAGIPMTIERSLRPADYVSRLKVLDANSGAEAVLETNLTVPQLEESAERLAQQQQASEAVERLYEEMQTAGSGLRIVPLGDSLLTGLQSIETIVTGSAIKAVEFYLDGKKVMTKRQPPYTLDVDLGNVPQPRRIKAVGLDEKGNLVLGDDLVVNSGNDPFRVRIVSPRIANKLTGKVRVVVQASVPDGKELESVEIFLNETRIATLFDDPFVQTVVIPENLGIGYLRAVASLKEEKVTAEDVVFINTPAFMETLDVHLVELPTTVISGGKPVTGLESAAFKVLDQGTPVKVAKFEYVKNLPLSIGMAVDTSGSMKDRMLEAQKAGSQFFKNVLKPGDRAFVVAFSSEPELVQKWTSKLSDVTAALASMRAAETTSLNDAVVFSLYNFQKAKGQKALVLISDGKDTASKFSFEQALEYARRAAIPIYVVGIGIRQSEIDTRYKIGRFASETGGTTYYIEDANDLSKIYSDIQLELRSQYLLGFYPPDGVKAGGKWREVSVEVKGGKAKTIRGYYP